MHYRCCCGCCRKFILKSLPYGDSFRTIKFRASFENFYLLWLLPQYRRKHTFGDLLLCLLRITNVYRADVFTNFTCSWYGRLCNIERLCNDDCRLLL